MRQEGLRYLNGKTRTLVLGGTEPYLTVLINSCNTLGYCIFTIHVSQIFDRVQVEGENQTLPFVKYSCKIDGNIPYAP